VFAISMAMYRIEEVNNGTNVLWRRLLCVDLRSQSGTVEPKRLEKRMAGNSKRSLGSEKKSARPTPNSMCEARVVISL